MRLGISTKITGSSRPLSSSSSSAPVDERVSIALDLTDTYGVSSGANYLNVQFPYSFVELNSTTGVAITDPFANYRDSGAPEEVYPGLWYLPPIIEPLKITLTLNSGYVGSSTDVWGTYPAALAIYLSHHPAPASRELAFSEASLSGDGTPFGTTLDIINHTAIIGRGGAGGRGGLPGADKNGNNGPGGGGGGGKGFLNSLGGTATPTANPGAGGNIFSATAPGGGAGGTATGQSPSHLPGAGRSGGSAIALYQRHSSLNPTVSITNESGGLIFGAGGGGGGAGGSSSGTAGGDGGNGGLYGAPGTAGDNGPGANVGRQDGAQGGAGGKAIDESELGSDNFVNVEPTNNNTDPNTFMGSEGNYVG